MQKTVLILGSSGKIGHHSAEAFARAGWTVRRYDRNSGNMVAAAQGVDVIVNGLNPPQYHDWARLIPAITADVIAAAKASGATVIVPGNVYNLDDQGGEWSENTPHAPTTRKGRIREEMERAYRNSGVQTIVLRAGNFIDPHSQDDIMRTIFLRQLANGKLTTAGNPDALQAYCYVPDWAAAAVGLAERRATLAQFEDVPFAGHSFSAEHLRAKLSQVLGRPLAITRFPWWAMTLTAPFWELARELREMRYLFDLSHTLSGAKLARLLPRFRPTSLDAVILASVPAQLLGGTAERIGTTA
jgi:nucleoside-diphosphate-sugar epimerase